MILDELLEFADATSVGVPDNNTVNIGDIIDLGAEPQDFGAGRQMYLVIQIDTLVTSGGSAIVEFQLASDATSTISVTTQSVHYKSGGHAVATLVAGHRTVVAVPRGGTVPWERYMAFQINETSNNALTAGNISAFLTFDAPNWASKPDAVN